VLFDAGDRWLIAGNWRAKNRKKSLDLWDLASDAASVTRQSLVDTDSIGDIAFSPDKRWLITGNWGNADSGPQKTIRLWDMTVKNPGASPITINHGQKIDALKLSSNGRWLATAGFGNVANVWDLSKAHSARLAPMVLPVLGKGVRLGMDFSPRWALAGLVRIPAAAATLGFDQKASASRPAAGSLLSARSRRLQPRQPLACQR
jgi:hypothetical protein